MTRKQSRPAARQKTPPRMGRSTHHDTYASDRKSADAFVCDECGVVNHGGKWFWGAAPLADVEGGLCPACKRMRDRYPAGTIHLPTAYGAHLEEIRGMAHNAEEAEKAEHPLERLMGLEASDEGLVLTTTGVHLARRIATKLERRFHKQAKLHYPDEQALLFVEFEV